MKVTVLGNNSALPAFGRHPSAQAVSVWGEILLIDCGEGTQVQMQRFGIKWRNMKHIFISHMHGDHASQVVARMFLEQAEALFAPKLKRKR